MAGACTGAFAGLMVWPLLPDDVVTRGFLSLFALSLGAVFGDSVDRRAGRSNLRDSRQHDEARNDKTHPRKSTPPLKLLNALVKALWSYKTYNQVFKPVVADIVWEWKDARRHHEKFRAWWIQHVRGPYAIIQVALLQLPWSAIKKVASIVFKLSK